MWRFVLLELLLRLKTTFVLIELDIKAGILVLIKIHYTYLLVGVEKVLIETGSDGCNQCQLNINIFNPDVLQ